MRQKDKSLHLMIVQQYGSQTDFAMAAGEDETIVSRVLNGRRKLSPERAAKWATFLNCKPKALASVTE